MQATVSMQALLAYDPTLLDGMTFPDGMDPDAVKATIVQVCAPFEVMIPQPELCKQMLSLFSVRRKYTWKTMWETTQQDYDLLDEMGMEITTDGNDTDTRTPDLVHTRTPDLTTSGQNGGSDSTEQQVSAFNSSGYEPRERQTTTLGSTNTVHSTGSEETRETGTDSTARTIQRSVKTSGRRRPAGELLETARKAAEFDAYTYIAEDVKNNFCIRVY